MIPVLDWHRSKTDRAGLVRDLGKAVRDIGFAVLQNPDVPRDLRDRVFAHADAFFSLPEAEKQKISILDTPHFRGWGKPGDESLDETRPEVDTKQTFNIGYDLAPDDPRVLAGDMFRGVNRWPAIDGFSQDMRAYYDAAQNQALAILALLAEDLGLEPGHFAPLFDAPLSALRLLQSSCHGG